MDDKKLYLLDAYALIYRAYYALIRSPRFTSDGFNTSAIFGFCNTLDEVLKKDNPSHIAVCFDPPHGATFRHDVFPEYKAKREAQPEDITLSIPIIKEIIEAYNIPIFEVDGYEADDVIGTLSRIASEKGYTTYMMTPDKDYGQLVDENVYMLRPSLRGEGGEVRGPKEVCEKYGIKRPGQVVDLLALEGDAVDNIPGCPGVGEKTAVKLIAQYDNIENLIECSGGIEGAVGRKIRENADKIRLSYNLATIRRDVPIEVNFDDLCRKPVDYDRLADIYQRLEFKAFLSRISDKIKRTPSSSPVSTQREKSASQIELAPSLFDFVDDSESNSVDEPDGNTVSLSKSEVNYAEAVTIDELSEAVRRVSSAASVGVAIYAIGEEAMTANLQGIAFSCSDGKATYVRIPMIPDKKECIMSVIGQLFTNKGVTIVSHDIKRDMLLLRRENIEIIAPYFDTSLAHYVLQPEMRHRLSDVAMSVLKYQVFVPEDTAVRKGNDVLPPQHEVTILCEQADICRRMKRPLEHLLSQNGQLELLQDVELPMARVLAAMEWTGVRIDTDVLNRLSQELSSREKAIEEAAFELAGRTFNIASPMQVGEILFGQLKLDPKAKRTKTGAYSTTEEVLEKHRHNHPIVSLILDARSLKKLLGTYVNALPALVNRSTGKIHTTFNQTVTATGRLSSANPNLQNIPIRTDDGREVRMAFVADDGCVLMSADYSQIELRLLAALSSDPELTEAFQNGLDIHRATAAKIYHVPYEDVTDDQRRKAKTANFGTVYGISAFGLAERLAIPRVEARELINSYFDTYPHIQEFIAESTEKARQNGFVSTILGRKRFLPDINSRNATVRSYAERNAVNAPLQGSAADIIKVAMIRIYNRMESMGLKSRMILQVHDELVFNVYPDELETLKSLVVKEMEGAFCGSVPLEVSVGVGANWLEAH